MTYKHVLRAKAEIDRIDFIAQKKAAQKAGTCGRLRKFICVKCKVKFLGKSAGRLHWKVQRKFMCPVCFYEKFGTIPELSRYQTETEIQDEKRYADVNGVTVTQSEESRFRELRIRLKRKKLERIRSNIYKHE